MLIQPFSENERYTISPAQPGHFRQYCFDPAVQLLQWNGELNVTTSFALEFPAIATNEALRILYVLTPNAVKLLIDQPSRNAYNGDISLYCFTSNTPVRVEVAANEPYELVGVYVREEWIQSNVKEANLINDKLHRAGEPMHELRPSLEEYKMVKQLYLPDQQPGSRLLLYARTLELLSCFFQRTLSESEGAPNGPYTSELWMVEKLLLAHFETALPAVEELAVKAGMSVSSLKRHFHAHFGKSIYAYYLEKKMEYARHLLLHTDISVKELAYRLDYEKTSNFIQIFRKYYGETPGSLRKAKVE